MSAKVSDLARKTAHEYLKEFHFRDIKEDADDVAELAPFIQKAIDENSLSVVSEINTERERQKSKEGWSEKHDDGHTDGSLAQAAACYADPKPSMTTRIICDDSFGRGDRGTPFEIPKRWPWGVDWWKPKDRRRNLIRAGALIVAEIERLDRAERKKHDPSIDYMPKIDGHSFRCSCGCNVFRKPYADRLNIYRCNGCAEEYAGE